MTHILLYDSHCFLCNRFAQAIVRLDKNHLITPVCLHEFVKTNSWFSLEELLSDVHFLYMNSYKKAVTPPNEWEVYKGEAAAEKIVSLLPAIGPIAWMIRPKMSNTLVKATYLLAKKIKSGCSRCPKKITPPKKK